MIIFTNKFSGNYLLQFNILNLLLCSKKKIIAEILKSEKDVFD